jgi:hypothetical protein
VKVGRKWISGQKISMEWRPTPWGFRVADRATEPEGVLSTANQVAE